MIGIYDSGLGGLSAYRELRRLCPTADIVYLADSAHLPYGDKTEKQLQGYAKAAFDFFECRGAEYVIVACGTVSAAVLPHMHRANIRFYGVIEPAAKAACEVTLGRVAVLATAAAVNSGAYLRAIRRYGTVKTRQVCCPLWVPMLECGVTDNGCAAVREAVRYYTSSLLPFLPDTVILGCTHYPFLQDAISCALPECKLIDCGAEAARTALRANPVPAGRGRTMFCTTASPAVFARGVRTLIGHLPGTVQHIDPGSLIK